MRNLSLILFAAGLSACATAPAPQDARSAEDQARLQELLAGKTAGQPVSCLPHFRADNMTVIDEDTVLFSEGSTIYRNDLRGPCAQLGRPGYAMLNRNVGGTGLCRGEIVTVVDTSSGMTVGSCTFGDFVPYRAL